MSKHVVTAGTLLTVLAACACSSVPYLTYEGDDASTTTTPSSDPRDATATPVVDTGATTPPPTPDTGTTADAGTTVVDAGVSKDAGCGGGPLAIGFVCCDDVVCKSDSCSSDTCRQCPVTCPLPWVCCEQRQRGGFGGGSDVRCSALSDCR